MLSRRAMALLVSIKLFNCRSTFLFWWKTNPHQQAESGRNHQNPSKQSGLVHNCHFQLLDHDWKQLGEIPSLVLASLGAPLTETHRQKKWFLEVQPVVKVLPDEWKALEGLREGMWAELDSSCCSVGNVTALERARWQQRCKQRGEV